jgi:7-cyano-7-deazaguanine synthase
MRALLLSGGVDSSALAFAAKPDIALGIDYGQVAAVAELEAAAFVASKAGIQFESLQVSARSLGGGSMSGMKVSDAAPCPEFWPFRNQFILTLAAMACHQRGVTSLLFGAVKSDGDWHRDGSSEFFRLLSNILGYQEGGMSISVPAIEVSTTDLVLSSGIPRDVLAATHSCHVSNLACGQCRGCAKREGVFYDLGLVKI